MQSIWDDVDLMHAASRVMLSVAAVLLIIAAIGWGLQRPFFEIRQFRFVGDVAQMEAKATHELIAKELGQGLSGGFFSMDLTQVQNSLQSLGWVKATSVRKVWPHEIEITMVEHQPLAIWKQKYLSAQGVVFPTQLSDKLRAGLIVSEGPEAAAPLVAETITKLQGWLAPLGWQLKKVVLSERYSWQVGFSNGVQLELGRMDTEQALEERVKRLVQSKTFVQNHIGKEITYIDLRYPNGFAMRSERLQRVVKGTGMMINTGDKQ